MEIAQLNLEPLVKKKGRGKFVALDAFKRLALSADLRREIGLPTDRMTHVYVFVDRANKYLAFSRPDDVTLVKGAEPYHVSKRGYVYAPAIFDALGMPIKRAVFNYEGTADHLNMTWQLCKLTEEPAD